MRSTTTTTPFGTYSDVLVANFVQTFGSTSVSAAYYMLSGTGVIRVDYPGSPPRYAKP